jgi:hypothetical protein
LVTSIDSADSLTEAKDFILGFSLLPVFPPNTISELNRRILARQRRQNDCKKKTVVSELYFFFLKICFLLVLKFSRQRTALLLRWVGRVCLRDSLQKNKRLWSVLKLVLKTIGNPFLTENQIEKALQLNFPHSTFEFANGIIGAGSSPVVANLDVEFPTKGHKKGHNNVTNHFLLLNTSSPRRSQFLQHVLTEKESKNSKKRQLVSSRKPKSNRTVISKSKRSKLSPTASSTTTNTSRIGANSNNGTNTNNGTTNANVPGIIDFAFDDDLEQDEEEENNDQTTETNSTQQDELTKQGQNEEEETVIENNDNHPSTPKKRKRSPKSNSKKKVTKKSRR